MTRGWLNEVYRSRSWRLGLARKMQTPWVMANMGRGNALDLMWSGTMSIGGDGCTTLDDDDGSDSRERPELFRPEGPKDRRNEGTFGPTGLSWIPMLHGQIRSEIYLISLT
jgi:hypothetical protein